MSEWRTIPQAFKKDMGGRRRVLIHDSYYGARPVEWSGTDRRDDSISYNFTFGWNCCITGKRVWSEGQRNEPKFYLEAPPAPVSDPIEEEGSL